MQRPPMSAGLIALAAVFATIAVVLVVSVVAVVFVNPGGDMRERGRLVGEGLAKLSLAVGTATYAGVRLWRARKPRLPR